MERPARTEDDADPAPSSDGAGTSPAPSPDGAEPGPASADDRDGPRPARLLDCRGLYCPLPVLRTERALADLAVGEVLEVVATDPVAEIDMAVFSQRSGHPLLRRDRRGDEWLFRFRKAGAETASG